MFGIVFFVVDEVGEQPRVGWAVDHGDGWGQVAVHDTVNDSGSINVHARTALTTLA